MRPSRSNPCGWKPGMPASQGSRPEYDVSMCPLNISVGPPPVPARVASTFARPSSTCCHCTASPSSCALAGHPGGHRLLGAGEARDRDGRERVGDQALAVDHRSGPPMPGSPSGGTVRRSSRGRHPATAWKPPTRSATTRVPQLAAATRPRGSTSSPRRQTRISSTPPVGDVRIREARVRIDAPLEHRPRHVHRARDDAVAGALVGASAGPRSRCSR